MTHEQALHKQSPGILPSFKNTFITNSLPIKDNTYSIVTIPIYAQHAINLKKPSNIFYNAKRVRKETLSKAIILKYYDFSLINSEYNHH
jgi:hypothetical protein